MFMLRSNKMQKQGKSALFVAAASVASLALLQGCDDDDDSGDKGTIANCKTMADDDATCTECDIGYTLSSDKKQCDPNVANCLVMKPDSADTCVECVTGYQIANGGLLCDDFILDSVVKIVAEDDERMNQFGQLTERRIEQSAQGLSAASSSSSSSSADSSSFKLIYEVKFVDANGLESWHDYAQDQIELVCSALCMYSPQSNDGTSVTDSCADCDYEDADCYSSCTNYNKLNCYDAGDCAISNDGDPFCERDPSINCGTCNDVDSALTLGVPNKPAQTICSACPAECSQNGSVNPETGLFEMNCEDVAEDLIDGFEWDEDLCEVRVYNNRLTCYEDARCLEKANNKCSGFSQTACEDDDECSWESGSGKCIYQWTEPCYHASHEQQCSALGERCVWDADGEYCGASDICKRVIEFGIVEHRLSARIPEPGTGLLDCSGCTQRSTCAGYPDWTWAEEL